jgi:molybdate transport system substrate-binding protein
MKTLLLATLLSIGSVRGADLIVAAASDVGPLTASLNDAFAKTAHTQVKFTLAASGSLAQQIENGAPFDVFLSADERLVKGLVASHNLEPNTIVYAVGRLGLWSRDGSVHSIDDLKKPTVKFIAIANPEHAPYGVAAKKALETRKLWSEVQPKIVYGENVRQALQLAETGNADAVITSWTLLVGRGVLLPAEWHDPIRQSGGVVKTSKQPEVARQFLNFLSSAEGRKILENGGLFAPK